MTIDDTSWISDFVACLSGSSLADLQIEKAALLKHPHLPKRLYRYRSVNAYSRKNLEDSTEWLSSANAYNDPYDSAVTFSPIETGKAAARSQFGEIAKCAGLESLLSAHQLIAAKTADDPIKTVTAALLAREFNDDAPKVQAMLEAFQRVYANMTAPMVSRMRDHMQAGTKVCSFSTVPESIIMWSHYANYHRGFCVEYHLEDFNDPRKRALYPVIYSPELFDATKYIVAAMEGDGSFNNLFGILAALHKSPEWAYEGEWRFALPMGESFPGAFPMPRPRRLYLGSRIPVGDEEAIMKIAQAKSIECSRMSLSQTTFALTSAPI